ncbi:MAG: N-6 DNA methylase [Candidatus Saccharibacteria bacterium]|nr:N-6 DNA methylase [Candidatus Saccharibacteria bacterium]
MTISWTTIVSKATKFARDWQTETYEKGESQTFWLEFFQIFGIDRRRVGAQFEYPARKNDKRWGYIDLFWPSKLLVEHKSAGKDLNQAKLQALQFINELQDQDLPEAIVVCDFKTFKFISLTNKEKNIDFSLKNLPQHVQLFDFLLGQTTKYVAEQDPVNRKAAESMAELHNKLQKNKYAGEDLEILLVRLVFMMFAEDSNIFERGILLDYVSNHVREDGSDLGRHLVQIFEILHTEKKKRQIFSNEILSNLPYINGLLFEKQIRIPVFDAKMRQDLIEAMKLDWSKVSPAIFGSMFQGVVNEEQRRNLGVHYTSEVNILKVIKPLFLDNLYAEFRAAMDLADKLREDALHQLHDKISNLKFLDPACGCGNFLVITYRELRKLEHKIIEKLYAQPCILANTHVGPLKINIDQMYGIEIKEFPVLIAQTALWLTDHQMNMEYNEATGTTILRIPFKINPTIVNANALTSNWSEVINPQDLDYILGNPPFSGSQVMTKTMKQELQMLLPNTQNTGLLDYVAGWYVKATGFMKQNDKIQTCLVSTNSITQGQQVAILWRYLLNQGVVINFAHRTFKWSNDAKGIAAIYCVIIGFSLQQQKRQSKYIYEYQDIRGTPSKKQVHNINGYLLNAGDIFIERIDKPLGQVPEMHFGNMPLDGGNFCLTEEEKQKLIIETPSSKKYIKHLIGARELLQDHTRYCLWLVDIAPNELKSMPQIKLRVEKVRKFRLASKAPSTRKHADNPTEFRDTLTASSYLVIPSTSSENREYIPIVFLSNKYIVNNSCHVIPNATLYHFGILMSRVHMDWMRAVGGRLESRYRYSKDIVYNNFPWVDIDNDEKNKIKKLASVVIDARKKYPKETLANLYDPILMPVNLRKAHQKLDQAVDCLYELSPDKSEVDRIEHLFFLHQVAKAKYQ